MEMPLDCSVEVSNITFHPIISLQAYHVTNSMHATFTHPGLFGLCWFPVHRVFLYSVLSDDLPRLGRLFNPIWSPLDCNTHAYSACRKTVHLNFPEKVSEAQITDALLLKLFKTTDRDKVEEIVQQRQKEKVTINRSWQPYI